MRSRGEDRPTALPSMCNHLRCKHQFCLLVSGPSGSGKSSFSISFLQNSEIHCVVHLFDGGVICCHSVKSAVPSQQLTGKKLVRFNSALPADI